MNRGIRLPADLNIIILFAVVSPSLTYLASDILRGKFLGKNGGKYKVLCFQMIYLKTEARPSLHLQNKFNDCFLPEHKPKVNLCKTTKYETNIAKTESPHLLATLLNHLTFPLFQWTSLRRPGHSHSASPVPKPLIN